MAQDRSIARRAVLQTAVTNGKGIFFSFLINIVGHFGNFSCKCSCLKQDDASTCKTAERKNVEKHHGDGLAERGLLYTLQVYPKLP